MLDVWLPTATRLVIRVANIIAEAWLFAADITYTCHCLFAELGSGLLLWFFSLEGSTPSLAGFIGVSGCLSQAMSFLSLTLW